MVSPRLVLVLGDQLSPDLSALRAADPARDVVVMAEVRAEADYVPHHRRKLAFVFACMRHFAQELREAGWRVDYSPLDAEEAPETLEEAVARALRRHRAAGVIATEPGEWRLQQAMEGWEAALGAPVKLLRDRRFLASRAEFAEWAEGRRTLRMEHFYRRMRRSHDILMEDGQPAGGKWNHDHDNRAPAAPGAAFPAPRRHAPDEITREAIAMVERLFPDRWGRLEDFAFAVTRADAGRAAAHFMRRALPDFGATQDAMLRGERFLNHAVLSQYLNIGLLDPLDLCRRAEAEWRAGRAPINAVEGFVRQILGWREYVRGLYWLEGPDYASRNHLGAERPLPGFYWWPEQTDMACLRAVVEQTRDEAYAHHIQRLMVGGTFALIAGIAPRQVHEWYLSVYADAYEWVEAPNVIGMSLYADGGRLGSKPYAASGSYIDRMSDYCAGCAYDVKTRTGPGACPFNPLYWDFLHRNRARLKDVARLGTVYSAWDRMSAEKREAYLDSAAEVLGRLDRGERV